MSDNTTLDKSVASYYISNHIFVVCQLNIQKPATLQKTMDDHALEKTKTVNKKPAMPWYNKKIKRLKRDKRKAERQRLQHRVDPIKCNMQRKEQINA